MAGVQGSALAIAVSNAGALGSLPCATLSAEAMRKELTTIAAQTNRPYNVNFFCHSQPQMNAEHETQWRRALLPYYAELNIDPSSVVSGAGHVPFDAHAADLVIEFRPPVVSFHSSAGG
jgi:nitronate monooxygenase